MKCTRIVLDSHPFEPHINQVHIWGARKWNAHWIKCGQAFQAPAIVAFRRKFELANPTSFRIHISADERYQLYIDGQCVARGPERGDQFNWFYDSYELELPAGPHLIVARVWNLGAKAPYAQMSCEQGFLLAVEGPQELAETLQTEKSWECKTLTGYDWAKYPHDYMDPPTGTRQLIDGALYCWNVETDTSSNGWLPVEVGPSGERPYPVELGSKRALRPALLPAMIRQPVKNMLVRHADDAPISDNPGPILRAHNNASQSAAWQKMLDGQSTVTIPANSRQHVVIDLQDYYCAYPYLTTSGGGSASASEPRAKIRFHWAEALFESYNRDGFPPKGNRDIIENKFFRGHGDTFILDGGSHRRYETLWWRSGRYIEITVEAGSQPVIIHGLNLEETRYPLNLESTFTSTGPGRKLEELIPMCVRALQNCSHETYMDCPFYEQLMYVGDTRLEALITHTVTRDARLPRKAVEIFGSARLPDGLTPSRHPSRILQVIPPFSLVWVTMVHDLALWRGDLAFIKKQLSAVHGVLEAFARFRNANDLIEMPNGWNFVDWSAPFEFGIPKDAHAGVSGILNLQYIYTLSRAVNLYELAQEPELAARLRGQLQSALQAVRKLFWDDKRGLFADDLTHSSFSEHAQCMAVLSGQLTDSERTHILEGLLNAPDLARTTIYFSHYLLETFREYGRVDVLLSRFKLWFDTLDLGFRTTPEAPEPTRSDCHAWGATPVYHYFATILGIRPTGLGFSQVEIRPQLGTLTHAAGKLVHPNGFISASFRQTNGQVSGTIELPPNTTGVLIANNQRFTLQPGIQKI